MVTSNYHACNATNSPAQNRAHHLSGKQDGTLFDLGHAASFPASFGSGHQSGMPGLRLALTHPLLPTLGVHGNSRSALRQTGTRNAKANAPLWSLRGHSPQSWITILRAVILKPLSVSAHRGVRAGLAARFLAGLAWGGSFLFFVGGHGCPPYDALRLFSIWAISQASISASIHPTAFAPTDTGLGKVGS